MMRPICQILNGYTYITNFFMAPALSLLLAWVSPVGTSDFVSTTGVVPFQITIINIDSEQN